MTEAKLAPNLPGWMVEGLVTLMTERRKAPQRRVRSHKAAPLPRTTATGEPGMGLQRRNGPRYWCAVANRGNPRQ
jgi:hypothetical protein